MIRTIVKAEGTTLTLSLPENYRGKKIEIIAFAVDEIEAETRASSEKEVKTFSALELDTKGYKFNREEANER